MDTIKSMTLYLSIKNRISISTFPQKGSFITELSFASGENLYVAVFYYFVVINHVKTCGVPGSPEF